MNSLEEKFKIPKNSLAEKVSRTTYILLIVIFVSVSIKIFS